MKNLSQVHRRDNFQTAVASYMTNMLINNQELTELRRIFEASDVDNDGTLSREELRQSMQAAEVLLGLSEESIDRIF